MVKISPALTNDELKSEFDALCQEFGMNATVAFNIFARLSVREKFLLKYRYHLLNLPELDARKPSMLFVSQQKRMAFRV